MCSNGCVRMVHRDLRRAIVVAVHFEVSMRKSDVSEQKSFFRSVDRFFQVNGQWYFSAREGDIGPFRSRDQALSEATAYIKAKQGASTARQPDVGVAQNYNRSIPTYVYRSVHSMEQTASRELHLILDLEGAAD